MFDSLYEQIRSDEHKMTSNRERTLFWLVVGLVSVTVFAGLYFAVRFMQG